MVESDPRRGEELFQFLRPSVGKCKGVLAARSCLFRTAFIVLTKNRSISPHPPAHQQKGGGGGGGPGFKGGSVRLIYRVILQMFPSSERNGFNFPKTTRVGGNHQPSGQASQRL